MDTQLLTEQIAAVDRQVQELRSAGDPVTRHDLLLNAAFQELHTTLEELRVAEEELRQQNEELALAGQTIEAERLRYQDLFESAPDAYLVTDLSGTIQQANRAAAALLGVDQSGLRRRSLASFVAPEARRDFRDLVSGLAQATQAVEQEFTVAPREGHPVEAAVTAAVVRDPLGKATGLRWLLRDITPRRRAEAERYRLLVEEIKDYAIFLTDPEGGIQTWNTGAETLFGYTAAEAVGQNSALIFTPEERAQGVPDQEREQAAQDGRAADERWHIRRDGSRFWANGVLTALRDRSGHLAWFAKVLRDETAERLAADQREREYRHERHIAETLQDFLQSEVQADLPRDIQVEPFYAAAWEEARLGGDFYEVLRVDDSRVAIFVGDVSGKGLGAAVRAAEVRSILRAFLRETPDPGRAMTRLNAFLCDRARLDDGDGNHPFLTLALAVLEPATGRARIAGAGTEPPLRLLAGGGVEEVAARGRLLGVEPQEEYASITLNLDPGDILLLVTDGITEARIGREFLGYDGFVRLAQELAGARQPQGDRPGHPERRPRLRGRTVGRRRLPVVSPARPRMSGRAENRKPALDEITHSSLPPAHTLPPLKGEVCTQYICCRKPGCRCAEGHLHGPYYYRVWREDGRVHKVYVKREELEAVQAACAAYKSLMSQLKDQRHQREQIARSLARTWRATRTLLRQSQRYRTVRR